MRWMKKKRSIFKQNRMSVTSVFQWEVNKTWNMNYTLNFLVFIANLAADLHQILTIFPKFNTWYYPLNLVITTVIPGGLF